MANRFNVRRPSRFACGTLLAMLICSSSYAEADRRAANDDVQRFEQYAAGAIYKVFPLDRQEFYLTVADSSKRAFAFFNPTSDGLVAIKCGQAAHFRIVRHANEVADLSIGECGKERSSIEEAVRSAPTRLKQALGSLSANAPSATEEQLRRMGFFYEKRLLADGYEQHYFPVLIVSHGLIFLPTIVVVKGQATWVVQANTTNLCSQDEHHPLCSDVAERLSRIAANLVSGKR